MKASVVAIISFCLQTDQNTSAFLGMKLARLDAINFFLTVITKDIPFQKIYIKTISMTTISSSNPTHQIKPGNHNNNQWGLQSPSEH